MPLFVFENDKNAWIVEYGANDHMSGNKNLLVNMRMFKKDSRPNLESLCTYM